MSGGPEYRDLRVLVLRENWLGCTGLGAFNALLRTGAITDSITESEFVPITWKSLPLRFTGKLIRSAAATEFNRALLRQASQLRPDIFLAFKGTFVFRESLRKMTSLGITRYCFFPDVSFFGHGPYIPQAMREYDWIFSTKSFGPKDAKEALGIDCCSYLPHALDADVYRPRAPFSRDDPEFSCDVSFIGNWSPRKASILEELARRRPDVKLRVWGNNWGQVRNSSPLSRHLMLRGVTGVSYAAAVSRSKISLGLLSEAWKGASSGDQITARTFAIPGCGGLLLHERTADLLDLFTEDVDCGCFVGASEMVDKISYLLQNEAARLDIALRGRELVLRAHTWDRRIRTILDHYLAGQQRG